MDKSYKILFGFVRFEPMINSKYSWINSMLDLGIGKTMHVILGILALMVILLVYSFIGKMYSKTKLTDFLFMCLISAAICSLIDKLFWGGSLDYIQFKGLFTFDLKDVYVTTFEVLLISMLVFNYKKIWSIEEKQIFNDFKKYISMLVKRN
jgi:signal peptidase II